MNFFEHQERARRNTRKLVILFALAVLCITAGLYFVALGAVSWVELVQLKRAAHWQQGDQAGWWRPEVLAGVIAGALAIIGGGSLYKIHSLSEGGAMIAAGMEGRYVDPATTDPDERRLINVVEEMAIASGVPMPLVFVLENEEGINAFAAGYSANDAAVAVTKGTLRLLKRDELQGVIAHEFSHVLSGDMRLNIRLVGLIYGILIVAVVGTTLIRAAGRSQGRRGSGAVLFLLVGLALTIIGYVGVFFGRLIRAAVSRQREFLADASAVDFTRNPDGIAGALKKIGGYGKGSRLLTPEAEAVAHMLFGDWRMRAFQAWGFLSTHPPLIERIRRIDPSFEGAFPKVDLLSPRYGPADEAEAAEKTPAAVSGFAPGAKITADPGGVVRQIGSVRPAHLQYGAALIASLPPGFRQAVRTPAGAVSTVYALLLDSDETKRQQQLALLQGKVKPALMNEVLLLFGARAGLDPAARLPLIELATAALRRLDDSQYAAFSQHVQLLAGADQQTTIFEFALQQLLTHRLRRGVGQARGKEIRYAAFTPLAGDCLVVLSLLACVGQRNEEDARRAFAAGAVRLREKLDESFALLPAEACTFAAVEQALERLALAAPIIKQRVVDAFTRCVLVDGMVTIEEAELLRAMVCSLDCPMPPFLPAVEAKTTEE